MNQSEWHKNFSSPPIGIEAMSFYTSSYYLDLADLASKRDVPYEKYADGIGQEKMSVAPPDEDIVTMAANAAKKVLKKIDVNTIDLVLFATESGIDQSKSAGVYLHRLMHLPKHCRVLELKQACYSATGALQLAVAWVRSKLLKKVLILASDIARYGLNTPGEVTQGCAAVALVVSANPMLMTLEPQSVAYTEDVMDFWRPNYMEEALVDGKYSTKVYLNVLSETWKQYQHETGHLFTDFDYFCYHTPFTKMAEKAHARLLKLNQAEGPEAAHTQQIKDSLLYTRQIGNSYTASLYLGLTSLLDHAQQDLGHKRIGLFSFGSGCSGEFFQGTLQAHYKQALHTEHHQRLLQERQRLSYAEYEEFYLFHKDKSGGNHLFPSYSKGSFRLAGIQNHQRLYEEIKEEGTITERINSI